MSDGWLGQIGDALAVAARQRYEFEKTLAEKLGPPDLVQAEDAFWRVKGGIVSYKFRFNNTIDSFTRKEIADSDIQMLYDLLKKEPRSA